MRTSTVYIAVDGRSFLDAQGCKDHEERLFNAWLKSTPTFDSFLAATRDATRRAVIRDYWEHITTTP